MKLGNFIFGLIVLVAITVGIYIWFGFEITIIFLIIDFSVGVSYQFDKLNKVMGCINESPAETATKIDKMLEEKK